MKLFDITDREADYTEVKDDSADKRQKEDILQEKNPTAGSTSVPGDREAELLVKSCSKMPKKKDAKLSPKLQQTLKVTTTFIFLGTK